MTKEKLHINVVFFVAIALEVWIGLYFFAPVLTSASTYFLQHDFLKDSVMTTFDFWGGRQLQVLVMKVDNPSPELCHIVAIACLLALLFVKRTRLPLPVIVMINILATMLFLFTILFMLFPQRFHMDSVSLANFFVAMSLASWGTMPILFGLSMAIFPAGLMNKILLSILLQVILLPLFVLKYLAFLLACSTMTFLVLPLAVTLLGPLLDVIYMISLFSWFLGRVAQRLRRDTGVWQWT